MAKVLIVDDDCDFGEGLKEALELFNHRVNIAFSGESGIIRCRESMYDVALIDICLPDLSGVKVLSAIKNQQPGLCGYLLTGYNAHQFAQSGAKAGAIEVLTKPIQVEKLSNSISHS